MRSSTSLKKRGQIQELGPSVIVLVIAGVFLVFGLLIIGTLRDTTMLTQVYSVTTLNETITTFEADHTLVGAASPGANAFVVTLVTNATVVAETVAVANYTISDSGVLSSFADATWNGTDINVSYTYAHGDVAYESTNDTLVGLSTFADFWEIIILAVVIGIVIGLLLVVFGGRRTR